MKRVQSTCNFCALDCNIDFYVEDNKIVKVVPTKGYPVNDGFSCIKGLSLDKQQTVVKGSKLPKVRQKDGSFKTMEWDDTFKYVADKFIEIKEKYGSESIAGISTGQLTLEEFALLGHVMRNHLKANLDGNTRLCMATAVVAHKQSYGFDSPPYTLNDVELSDTVILIGANPVVAHPILWDRIRSNKNKKLIVIDPRKSETAQHADYWYGLKGKSDLALFYTVANILIEKGYVNKEYIENYTEGYEDFKEFAKAYTLEKGAEITGLKEEQILELVELIHEGKRVSFWWTMGVNQGYEAVRTAQAIINLALMTGNIGRPGTGANSLTGQCNAMGSRAYSNTAGLYGGGDFDNPVRRKRVAEVLGVDESVLAQKPTAPYNVIVEKIISGEIKALWVVCTNPRHSWTNNKTFMKAVENLELFVVQDIYDDTDSAKICDVYLPVVPGIKKEGSYINTERRISAMRPALEKEENEKTDYEVMLGIGKALGMGDLLDKWQTPRDAFNLMKECSRNMPCDMTGVDYDGLVDSNGIQWPFREGEELKEDQRRLFEDNLFYTPSKKAKFIFEDVKENPLPTSEEFPLIFNTGRGTVGQWHTQTRTREVRFIEDVSIDTAYIFMNTKLAEEKNIKENDMIRVNSINGESADFMVKITDNQRYEELYAPMHYLECNKLTPSIYDPYSKEPSYKTTPINIEKL
ncbi:MULTISPECIES: molybdopterin oxidoreductase family protein [Clostridium]|uniref:Nitrate reductase, catalytic subunit n=1 Tax=Clostridium butyricum E4 str. BoNT E BL5262 TaxID=632245 RepID=C4IKV5_CLOBU|nr:MULTISPECIES: molybdopterin oxidoreductase family protein [Clostridium]EDT73384.1 nitrate reductase, catalytic subunit [Clostridium butyricum 5521]EEP53512.1 nitrate reductase, catalytic subunit [Clostridium butyricum E4 str. BoNT E BL5262]EMU55250.1 nitrate reductase, catalytic subunit [Clostridium butyricum DKU-01]MBO1686281.1 molybdopterin oxidoreductase family protein [Clostridium butyricum]MDU4588167.1 molybdopterin oxidoreductase family protein [Clostridium sp.]